MIVSVIKQCFSNRGIFWGRSNDVVIKRIPLDVCDRVAMSTDTWCIHISSTCLHSHTSSKHLYTAHCSHHHMCVCAHDLITLKSNTLTVYKHRQHQWRHSHDAVKTISKQKSKPYICHLFPVKVVQQSLTCVKIWQSCTQIHTATCTQVYVARPAA